MEPEQFQEAGRLFQGQEHKIMGLSNVTPRQEFVAGMEHHQPHRLMGIHPDDSISPEEQQRMLMERQQQALMVRQGHDINPFAAEQYNTIPVPDAPLSYGGGMADQLLNDNEVPESVRKKHWFVFHKDNVLTFLDEGRKASKLLNFDIIKIDMLNATPYYEYTFEKELEFNKLRNVFETKLDRALGFKGGGIKNERIMLQSQFSESRQISEDGNQNVIKEGFFKRLLGRR